MRWFVLAVLLFVLAVTLNLNLLVYALYAIAAILVISRYVTSRWSRQMHATRELSQTRANIGETIEVDIGIQNQGSWPITWMIVDDLIPGQSLAVRSPGLKLTGSNVCVTRFSGGESKRLKYKILCNRRGYYQIGPTLVETGDMFGFNRKFKILAAPNFVLVYPKVVFLSGYDISSKRPIGEVIMTNRLFEDPTRIAGVRDYQAGDAFNRIHWKSTAATGKLQSKIYEPSSLAGATFIVDFHQDSFDPKNEPVRSELAITAAASISNVLHELGQQIGLISNGRDAVDRIRTEGWQGDSRTRDLAKSAVEMKAVSERLEPVVVRTAKAPQQHLQIMHTLARLELTDGLKLPELLVETGSAIPRDATVIAIVSQITMENAVALGGFARQGYRVLVIVNCFDDQIFAQTSAPLLAGGISVAHLKDEENLRAICERTAIIS